MFFFPHLFIATRARVPSEAHATNITIKPWIWQRMSPNNQCPNIRTAMENGASRSNIMISDIARDITKYAGMLRRRWFLYRTKRTAKFPTVPINTIKAYRNASPAAEAVERDNSSSCKGDGDNDVEDDMILWFCGLTNDTSLTSPSEQMLYLLKKKTKTNDLYSFNQRSLKFDSLLKRVVNLGRKFHLPINIKPD